MGGEKSAEEKQRLKELRDAEKQYLASLKEAEKGLQRDEKDYGKRIKAAEGELQRVKNPPPLGKYGSITLREDRVETASGNLSLFEKPIKVDVEASGNVAVHKDKRIDTRELYLKLSGPSKTHLEKCNPDHGEQVRELAVKIENAYSRAEKQRELRKEGIARAERDLEAARADRSDIEAAEKRVAEVRSQKATMDAKRVEAGLPPLAEEYYTPGRRRKRKVLIAVVAVVVLAALSGAIAAIGGGGSEPEPTPAAPVAAQDAANGDDDIEDASDEASGNATDNGSGGGATPAPPADSGDTGRMSEGEFSSFELFHEKLVDESLQWTDEYPTCATIGQTGDLAGFRDCIDEAWVASRTTRCSRTPTPRTLSQMSQVAVFVR